MDRLNKPWIVSWLIIISLLWGCTTTPRQQKSRPSGILDFSIEENYETVFRRITQQAKQCYEAMGREVEANLLREEEKAEVTIATVYRQITHILLRAEIKAITPEKTQINTYYSYSPPGAWRDGAYTLQRWAASEEPYCPH